MARYAEQTWHLGRVAAPLLADIAANHPRKVQGLAPLHTVFAGGPETVLVWNPRDERVDALKMLENEAFRSLEAKTDTHTAYALIPRYADVIDAAVLASKQVKAA